jgi:hypothetical protein
MDFPSCLRHDCLSCLKARTLLRASTSSKPGLSFVPPPGLSLYLKARTFLGVQPGYNNISISIRSLFDLYLYSISIRSLSLFDLYSISIWSLCLFDLYSISISIRSLFDLYLISMSIRSLFDLYLYSISIRSLFDLYIRSLFVLFIRSLFDLYSTTHHLILFHVSFYFCNPLSSPHSSLYSSRGSVGTFLLLQFILCVFIFKLSFLCLYPYFVRYFFLLRNSIYPLWSSPVSLLCLVWSHLSIFYLLASSVYLASSIF